MPVGLRGLPAQVRAIRAVDRVVLGGGGILKDEGLRLPTELLLTAVVARLAGRRLTLLGVGVGPFYRRVGRWLVTAVARLAHVRTVRDEDSAAALRSLGVSRVIVGADPIFSTDSGPDGVREPGRCPARRSRGRRAVVSVRPWFHTGPRDTQTVRQDALRRALADGLAPLLAADWTLDLVALYRPRDREESARLATRWTVPPGAVRVPAADDPALDWGGLGAIVAVGGPRRRDALPRDRRSGPRRAADRRHRLRAQGGGPRRRPRHPGHRGRRAGPRRDPRGARARRRRRDRCRRVRIRRPSPISVSGPGRRSARRCWTEGRRRAIVEAERPARRGRRRSPPGTSRAAGSCSPRRPSGRRAPHRCPRRWTRRRRRRTPARRRTSRAARSVPDRTSGRPTASASHAPDRSVSSRVVSTTIASARAQPGDVGVLGQEPGELDVRRQVQLPCGRAGQDEPPWSTRRGGDQRVRGSSGAQPQIATTVAAVVAGRARRGPAEPIRRGPAAGRARRGSSRHARPASACSDRSVTTAPTECRATRRGCPPTIASGGRAGRRCGRRSRTARAGRPGMATRPAGPGTAAR